jgi:uncharacterized protein YbjT (DUF2867 family)
MELVTGATGYVGDRLLARLSEARRPARALARVPARVTPRAGVEAVRGDLLTGDGVERALEGVTTAYYLVHSMEGSPDRRDFADRDRRAADAFGPAAAAAGVKRIVYLGGIVPGEDAAAASSLHLRSRLEVEQILLAAVPRSTALRASILIGARSASFRILVRLVERLRVLPLPGWRAHRTQPIDERDAIEFLARTPATPAAAGRSLDIAGPDVLSYADMIERIAELMGVGRLPLGLGSTLTPPASAMVSAVTGQPRELVRPLMESLEFDLLPRDADEAPALYGIRTHGFDSAVERALAEWETLEPLGAR